MYIRFFINIVIFSFFCSAFLYTQEGKIPNKIKSHSDSSTIRQIENIALSRQVDTNIINKSDTTIQIKKSKSGLDSVVVYSAKDSVIFNVKNKRMRLRGNSKLNYKEQNLEAEVIEILFEESILKASAIRDSSGSVIGFPKFTDKGESFYGESLQYNFKTQKGIITIGETEMSEGFYYGGKIKRVSENTLFIQDGCYTTCDKPHPHFWFGSPEMKVILQDRVFIDPLIVYIEDMPVFYLPIGLFFPSQGGRQSGLMIPTFFFSKNRGVVIENIGAYFALSDYFDTQLLLSLYSKGGYIINNKWRWDLRDVFRGDLDLKFGKTRMDPDQEFSNDWSLSINHHQEIIPQQTNLDAKLYFMSQNFNRNTSTNINDVITQNITSNASISHIFENGSSLSISLSRDQNIINNNISQTLPSFSFSIPQWNPLKGIVSSDSWLKDIQIRYSVSGSYYWESQLQSDSTYKERTRTIIAHRPSISISPKFGYFTVSPRISFSANNFFRSVKKTVNPADSSVNEEFSPGFFTEYWFDIGIDASTRLFGILKPKSIIGTNLFGITAFRHTFQPTVSFSYSPDFSSPKFGFYDRYLDLKTNKEIIYSRFSADGGGSAPRQLSQRISFNILNSFEAKLAQADTTPDKNLDLLRWNINWSIDMAKDSLKWSDIYMGFRLPTLSDINLTASADFTLYDEAPIIDPISKKPTNNYTPINTFLIQEGKGLMRLKNISLQMSTSFSSKGISFGSSFGKTETSATKDTIRIGERFKKRLEDREEYFDIYGNNTPGYTPLNIPWSISLSLNYRYSQPTINNITRTISLRANFNLNLTDTWSIDGGAEYDFVNNQILAPSINVKKDLHCWEFYFQWIPSGFNQGFYFRFNIKASQLRDLKIEKPKNRLYN